MEVGAVKQAFNNELILLKKKLNQAKIHIIHKLTRKAKTLLEKKPPEPLKEKLKRKAESAVNEVMIIKKIKARDIGKFIITHKGKLQDYLNKPQVDVDKACARLLLHKVMQEKYNFIRNRFLDVPIKDLFMSRQERLKLKKEARAKQKEKKKGKGKAVNAEGDWDVEDVQMSDKSKNFSEKNYDNEEKEFDDEQVSHDDGSEIDESGNESTSDIEVNSKVNTKVDDEIETDSNGSDSEEEKIDLRELLKTAVKKESKSNLPHIKETAIKKVEVQLLPSKQEAKKKSETKNKVQGSNKNKNLNEKLVSRKFKKDSQEAPIVEKKIVDPFFITATGDNYLTIAEPRQPDEVKEVHKQGNRKLRRAVMFGHVPKHKPRQDFGRENDRFDSQNGFEKRSDKRFNNDNGFQKNNKNDNRFSNRNENDGHRRTNFKDNARSNRNEQIDSKPEKLHPSWEAKKKQSGILPYQGKKIVFD